MDEIALPSGVLGPRDLAPLMRACSDLDRRDMTEGDSLPQHQCAHDEATWTVRLAGRVFGMWELGDEDLFVNRVNGEL